LINEELTFLAANGLTAELKRPWVVYEDMLARRPAGKPVPPREVRAEVECLVKYDGYIDRQQREIARARQLEDVRLPSGLDYESMSSLSREVREKLAAVRPMTLGQAARIPGVTPAAVSILAVYLRRGGGYARESAESWSS
jgi:tRNA uridine 5-carboxymethylaminomethyl modification enzyme